MNVLNLRNQYQDLFPYVSVSWELLKYLALGFIETESSNKKIDNVKIF